jgi:hypothetical protein
MISIASTMLAGMGVPFFYRKWPHSQHGVASILISTPSGSIYLQLQSLKAVPSPAPPLQTHISLYLVEPWQEQDLQAFLVGL